MRILINLLGVSQPSDQEQGGINTPVFRGAAGSDNNAVTPPPSPQSAHHVIPEGRTFVGTVEWFKRRMTPTSPTLGKSTLDRQQPYRKLITKDLISPPSSTPTLLTEKLPERKKIKNEDLIAKIEEITDESLRSLTEKTNHLLLEKIPEGSAEVLTEFCQKIGQNYIVRSEEVLKKKDITYREWTLLKDNIEATVKKDTLEEIDHIEVYVTRKVAQWDKKAHAIDRGGLLNFLKYGTPNNQKENATYIRRKLQRLRDNAEKEIDKLRQNMPLRIKKEIDECLEKTIQSFSNRIKEDVMNPYDKINAKALKKAEMAIAEERNQFWRHAIDDEGSGSILAQIDQLIGEVQRDYGQVSLPKTGSGDQTIRRFTERMFAIANKRYERNALRDNLRAKTGSVSDSVKNLMQTMKTIIVSRKTELENLSGISFDSDPMLEAAAKRLACASVSETQALRTLS